MSASLFVLASNTDKWWWTEWIERPANRELIATSLREHVVLTVTAVVVGLMIALPVAVYVRRHPRLRALALGTAGIFYTVPSLAVYGLLIPYTGLSRTTAVIPLIMYTILILLRNALTGLEQVSAEVLDASDGMGMNANQRLIKVELPLALPAILAGVRIAAVSTIGLLTIAALVGLGGLGQLILIGLNRPVRMAVTVGLGLSVILATVADLGLAAIGSWLTPWTRSRRAARDAAAADDIDTTTVAAA